MTGLILSLFLTLPLACGDKDGDDTGTDGGATDGGATDGGGTDGGGTTGDGGGTVGDGGGTVGDGGTDGGAGDGGTTGDGGTSGDGGTTGDGGTSGDGGTTGDGGTSGDGGTTGDGGTSGDGGGDGGAASCLEWTVRVVLADGSTCTTCPSGSTVSFQAQIENVCDFANTVTTSTACLVSSWTLESGSMGEGWGEVCGGAVTDWVIEGGSAISMASSYGRIGDGRYEVTADFNDVDRHSASQLFVVE